jgi:hypothetical protein
MDKSGVVREFVGFILLVPQGLAPLVVMSLLEVQTMNWSLVSHLPPSARVPAAIGFVVVGAAMLYSGIKAGKARG